MALNHLNLTVKLHPLVPFQIVESYLRRPAESNRVIGTLLGTLDKGVVEVTNCFAVPHKEYSDQVEVELNHAMDVYDSNKLVNSSENIVGWWATGNEVTNHSSIIHEYYSRECNNPVHLTLDTSLQGGRMGIKAYVCVTLGAPNGKQGCMFTPIPVEITSYDAEVYGLQLCSKTMSTTSKSRNVEPMLDLTQIAEASAKMTVLLEQLLAYVEDVLANRVPADNAVGRSLLDLMNSVPCMSPDQFSDMFNSNVNDLLMVVSLTELLNIQVKINEKLTLLTV